MVETFAKLPNDPFFEEMDPFVKLWLYESWLYKYEQDISRDRALGILIGSFTNPEAAKKMNSELNPQFISNDDEVEKIMDDISKENKEKERRTPKRQRIRRRK